jgi:peptide/nickel transport system ATP-binding protein
MSDAAFHTAVSDEYATLEVRRLQTHFFTREGELPAVEDVSLTLARGRVLGLVGESGSGKSVTGFSIMGLIDAPGRVVGGEILFKGRNLVGLPEAQMRRLRGSRIAMVFQDPMSTLNPVQRVDAQMIEAVRAHRNVSRSAAREQASEALAAMGIASPDERLRAYPHQLSGGMRQRVAIAIAMLHKPDLIIADEPTTALDVTIQAQILSEVQTLVRTQGTSLIWITHDLSVVAGLADDIAVMYAGRIVEQGTADAVLDHPQHPYTAGLIDSLPSLNTRGKRLAQIAGITQDLRSLPPGCAFAARCTRATALCSNPPALGPSTAAKASEHGTHLVRCFHPGRRADVRTETTA